MNPREMGRMGSREIFGNVGEPGKTTIEKANKIFEETSVGGILGGTSCGGGSNSETKGCELLGGILHGTIKH
jgi:hypothetical protein